MMMPLLRSSSRSSSMKFYQTTASMRRRGGILHTAGQGRAWSWTTQPLSSSITRGNSNNKRPVAAGGAFMMRKTMDPRPATAVRSVSGYSSFMEPDPFLFARATVTTEDITAQLKQRDDSQLRTDIRVMGSLLGKIIEEHSGPHIFERVEQMRATAKTWREQKSAGSDSSETFRELANYAASMDDEELFYTARAFTHFLAIANAAESHHRARRLRMRQTARGGGGGGAAAGALYSKSDSCGGVFPNLLRQHSAHDVRKAFQNQTVEFVLTAHPTEVNRRTILDKKRRIQQILTQADVQRAAPASRSPFEVEQLHYALYREISSLWLSDEVSREKPTPVTEAVKGGLLPVETVLWEALPAFLRKLNATAVESFQNMTTPNNNNSNASTTTNGTTTASSALPSSSLLGELPWDAAPIKFSSWMGGDRDGNPNVTANVTREVCWRNRAKAAELFIRDLKQLESELSITICSDELRNEAIRRNNKQQNEKTSSSKTTVTQPEGEHDLREPYRAFLRPMIEKMELTLEWAQQELQYVTDKMDVRHYSKSHLANTIHIQDIYWDKQELQQELELIHTSLYQTGNALQADGLLTDIMKRVSAFGLTLLQLDVRQEAGRHEEVMDAITRYLGLGSYAAWDEATKIQWLSTQIASKRPLLRPGIWLEEDMDDDNAAAEFFTPNVAETLETFQMIAEQHCDSLGAYVISQASKASDVLAVLLLQLNAGVKDPLRVVPLFETLDALNGAPDTMRTLFQLPVYVNMIRGKQEVMIGYSDSAKDAGRLAASWAQYETQEELARIAKELSIDLTFFHGKGGTVGRGGNPQTFLAIMSHAPETINGKFRVTEQGEMINQNFGFVDRAQRTMDIYTAAVLAEKLTPRPSPKQEWRDMMKKLSDISCAVYRNVVREDERFVPYFRAATPELELSHLKIGSRPAKRKASGGVESLRAIPWNFAWTQTRMNLPTWLGVGQAINTILANDKEAPLLREMYAQFDTFRTMIDLVEMVLAKSDPAIAEHYETMLVTDPKALELGAELRRLHLETERVILNITGHRILGENNEILQRQLVVRNPYVDCLNVLQVETLKRIRERESKEENNNNSSSKHQDDTFLNDALVTTFTGLANGMGNTG